ncbi:MAG: phosphoribosyltransferase family protein [Campylobacterota bacterium]|nr:phosphoribosyltransferase family protein [Campylobacterota bacterium]
MIKTYYSYEECQKDCKVLLKQLKQYNPDAIIAVARGGLTLTHLLSYGLGIREVYSLNSVHYDDEKKLDTIEISNIPELSRFKKVVVIDDIVDSGDTIKTVISELKSRFINTDFKSAVIFYKPDAIVQPDFKVKEAQNWIDFFWEVDLEK